jgi:putative phosphoesterase
MRVLLIADAHANWESLAALQQVEARPEAVLFAGDAVGYGPDPVQVVRWLLGQATAAVRGPLDRAVTATAEADPEGTPSELAEAARETLAYARRLLPPADRERLGAWPDTAEVAVGGVRFYLRHGLPAGLSPATAPEAELEALFGSVRADVLVLGGAHLPAIRRWGERVIVNPGSLGQPRYGVPDATYAVWNDGHLQIKHLHYDHDAVARRLRLTPLSPEVVEQLGRILESGMV